MADGPVDGRADAVVVDERPLRVVPIVIDRYEAYAELDSIPEAAEKIDEMVEALKPLGALPEPAPWEPGTDGLSDRSHVLKTLLDTRERAGQGHSGEIVPAVYWLGHGKGERTTRYSPELCASDTLPEGSGISVKEVADAIIRLLDSEQVPLIFLLDACWGDSFLRAVDARVNQGCPTETIDSQRYALVSARSDDETGTLFAGKTALALRNTIHAGFSTDTKISLDKLSSLFKRNGGAFLLGGRYSSDWHLPHHDAMRPGTPAEVQRELPLMPEEVREYFLPKASLEPLGDGYTFSFAGRSAEREAIGRWLEETETEHGILVVTGDPGAGKSALLGDVVMRSMESLHRWLCGEGYSDPCDYDRRFRLGWDTHLNLVGLSPQVAASRLEAVLFPERKRDVKASATPADGASRGGDPRPVESLIDACREAGRRLTILLDSLDESTDPTSLAARLLRPLANLPNVRLVVGTRRSTRSDVDQPAPADHDILTALGFQVREPGDAVPQPGQDGWVGTGSSDRVVTVPKDPGAVRDYLARRLSRILGVSQDSPDLTFLASQVAAEDDVFLYARLVAYEVEQEASQAEAPGVLARVRREGLARAIGTGCREVFGRAVERMARRNPDYRWVVQALALAQGRGLPLLDEVWSDVASALAGHDIDTSTVVDFANSPDQIYLSRDNEYDQTVNRLGHRVFAETIIDTYLPSGGDRADAHARIARHLAEKTDTRLHRVREDGDDPDGTPTRYSVNEYIVHYLPEHCALSGGEVWTSVGEHYAVLDRLDPHAVARAFVTAGFGTADPVPSVCAIATEESDAARLLGDPRYSTWRAFRARRFGAPVCVGRSEVSSDPPYLAWASLPPRAPHRRLDVVGPTTVLTFDGPDGRCLAVGQRDGTISIVDPATGKTRTRLTGHQGGVRALVCWSDDTGTRLASAGDDGTVRVWDPTTGHSTPLTGHQGWVRALVCWSDDTGTRLASAGDDGTVRVWDPTTGHSTPLTGHKRWVNALVCWSDDTGTRLASASRDGTVRVWDPTTGHSTPLTGHEGGVHALVCWSDDTGTRLASASHDGTVRVWDPTTGHSTPLTGHEDWVNALVCWSDDTGTRLASASYDGTVRVWDPTTGHSTPLTGHKRAVNALVCWSDDTGTHLASASDDGTVRVWDPTTGHSTPLTGHQHGVNALVCWSDDTGTHLASAGHDGTVRVCDPTTGHSTPLTGHKDRVNALVGWSDDTGTRLASASDDGTVRVWDPTTGHSTPLTGHKDWVNALVGWSDDTGTRLASASDDGTVRVWDPTTGHSTPLTGHKDRVNALVCWSDDTGTRLASASHDGTVRVWDPTSGHSTALTGHKDWVNALVGWSDDTGTRLASASDDGTVRVWDPTSGHSTALTGHKDRVNALVCWSDDTGTRLASASHDGTVRVWDPTTGHSTPLTGHQRGVTALVCWSDDTGTRLASASSDHTVRVWDPTTGHSTPLTGHQSWVTALVCWSDDTGTHLASASLDGTVRVWDPTDYRCDQIYLGEPVNSLAPGPGCLFVGTNSGGVAKLRTS